MNKFILPYIIICFLITFATATPISDLMSDEATNLTITISENETLINFYLNTSGYEWDNQEIKYKDYSFTIPASVILNNINLREDFNDSTDKITFSNVYISTSISPLLDYLFSLLDFDFTCEDINLDNSILTDLMNEYETEITSDSYFEKTGNNYEIWLDKGWGEIKEEDRNKSREYINNIYKFNINNSILNSAYSINPRTLIKDYLIPYVDFDLEGFLEEINYSVEIVSNVELTDGSYVVNLKIKDIDGNEIDKNVYVNLVGLPKYVYYFENSTFNKIEGLTYGTNVIIEELNNSYALPSNFKGLKYFNISTDNVTNGTIFFKLNKSEVTNPLKVSLYVWEGSWTKLTTAYLLDSGLYEFSAYTPHFSVFMIGEEIATTSSSSSHTHRKSSNSNNLVNVVQNTSKEEIKEVEQEDEVEEINLTTNSKKDGFDWLRLFAWIVIGTIVFVICRKIKKKRRKDE